MAEKTPQQIEAERLLAETMAKTGITLTEEGVTQDLDVFGGPRRDENPVTMATTFEPRTFGDQTFNTLESWNTFVSNQALEGFRYNQETNDFFFSRTIGEQVFTNPDEFREYSNQQALQGFDFNKQQGKFQFANLGSAVLSTLQADGTYKDVLTPLDTQEKWQQYQEQQAAKGFVASINRTPILDDDGNITGYEPLGRPGTLAFSSQNAMAWHAANSENFTRFPTVTGGDGVVFNGQTYRYDDAQSRKAFEDAVMANINAATDPARKSALLRQYEAFLTGDKVPGLEEIDDPSIELDEVFTPINYNDPEFGKLEFATPEELQEYINAKRAEGWRVTVNADGTLSHVQIPEVAAVDPANLKSILAGLGQAAPGFMYTWDEEAAAQVEQTYGAATAEAVRNAVQARIDLANMRAEALNSFYGGKYASAAKIEKFGWTGGAASDERMRMAYINASINSQMMTQKELIQAGFDSELAIAREFAKLNLMKLAEEKYQMAVTNSENFAKLTGYWIAPETKDVMSNYFAAESLPDGDPRKEAIMGGVGQYLKAQGIDEETWLAAQEFYKSLLQFNQTIEREMSELAKLSADREFNLRERTAGIDPATGLPIPTTPNAPRTSLPAEWKDESGSTFTRYAVEGTDGFVYFDANGNAYEAELDDDGNVIGMELREEGALKVVDGIEYFKDERGIYRDKDGFDIAEHPREGNTRTINGKVHVFTNGKWNLHSMYAKGEEAWQRVQVYHKTGTTPIDLSSATGPKGLNSFEWNILKAGYFEEGDIIKGDRLGMFNELARDLGVGGETYAVYYDGKLWELDKAVAEAYPDLIKNIPTAADGEFLKFLSQKSTVSFNQNNITAASLIGKVPSGIATTRQETETARIILEGALKGVLPNDSLIRVGKETLWHYVDGQFRKLGDDDMPAVMTKDIKHEAFTGGFISTNQNIVPSNWPGYEVEGSNKFDQHYIKNLISPPPPPPRTPTSPPSGSVSDPNAVTISGVGTIQNGELIRSDGTPIRVSVDANLMGLNGSGGTRDEVMEHRSKPAWAIVRPGDTYVDRGVSYTAIRTPNGERMQWVTTEGGLQAWSNALENVTSQKGIEFLNSQYLMTELDKTYTQSWKPQGETLLNFITENDKHFTKTGNLEGIVFYSRNKKYDSIEAVVKQMQSNLLQRDHNRLLLDLEYGIKTREIQQDYNETNRNNPFVYDPGRGAAKVTLKTWDEFSKYLDSATNKETKDTILTQYENHKKTPPVIPVTISGVGTINTNVNVATPPPSATTTTPPRVVTPPRTDAQRDIADAIVTGPAPSISPTTFRTSSQPSLARSKAGDVWINPSTGVRMIRIGNSWVASGGSGGGADNVLANIM